MYKSHPDFLEADENAKIWRYMDFSKYVSMLVDNGLFFTRGDKFEDAFEGSLPKANADEERELTTLIETEKDQEKIKDELDKLGMLERKFVAVNCWHVNDHESAAMWNLYLKSGEGIAIQSTVKNLKNSLARDPKEIHIGKINYIDYEQDRFYVRSRFTRFLHKRKSFEHEMELRALTPLQPKAQWQENFDFRSREPEVEYGLLIHADLTILIEGIFLAPNTPTWLEILIHKVNRQYGLPNPISPSSLDKPPLY